jgi:hypothetical protein
LDRPERDARIARLENGAVAQLGERRVRNAKVEGSIPFRSTIYQALTLVSHRSFFFCAGFCAIFNASPPPLGPALAVMNDREFQGFANALGRSANTISLVVCIAAFFAHPVLGMALLLGALVLWLVTRGIRAAAALIS